MLAEIITIGDELLIGQVVDTNSAWIASQLNMAGVNVHQITSISDNREHILKTLAEASQRTDILLITGGLGPTKDDITKKTLCEYFNTSLRFDEKSYGQIEKLFAKRGFPVTELNRQQAMVPDACEVIVNENGTAPGMWFEKQGKIYVSMPGVPFEMKPMVSDYVIPRLLGRTKQHIVHKTVLTEGIGESFLAAKIEDWEDTLPPFIKLAYLPQPGMVRLRLSATGPDKHMLTEAVDRAVEKLKTLAGEFIYGFDDDTFPQLIGELLRKHGQWVATAESCTGGNIAHELTSIAGSSDYFKGSVVAYSNEIKENILGVQPETIMEFGAVSEQTVVEMADGVRSKFNVDYALAVSGIAGPGGGTAEKPVGTTWIAVATPEKTITKKYLLGDHRGRNIQRASTAAMSLLLKALQATNE